jgi:nucleoside 2-deoxyribosyltransferase|tara:strand:+ start:811 stop:1356 length:546 start_codon:yes stop_codon:yes gene_type:complete
MNRLKGMRTYLAGAMDRVPDGGVGWRQTITPKLTEMGVVVLNPCDKPVEVGIEDDNTRKEIEILKDKQLYSDIRKKYGVIRTLDLRCVDISDFIIASIDIDVHACGTYEEIAVANSQKKPVLIWCQQGKKQAPNWLYFMLPHQHIFGDLRSLVSYLEYVNSCKEEVEHHKRWFFFDRERMK